MKRLFLIAMTLLLLSACGNKEKSSTPPGLLTEQEMIDVMTDVQIIEADINHQKAKEHEVGTPPKDYIKITRSYYQQLFEHYDINDSIFTQSMRYYTEQPEVLERIMDSVMQRLIKEQSTSSTQ